MKEDRHGKITSKAPLAVIEAVLAKYFAKQDPKSEVVVEVSGNWMFLYGTIEKCTPQAVLAHPLKIGVIAEGRTKTATIDATTLTELLRLREFPRRILRTERCVMYGSFYATERLECRCGRGKVHAMLTKSAIECSWSDVSGKNSQQWLKTLPPRPC